jgi:hypothetical protein
VWALDQSAAPVHGIEAAAEVAGCAGIPPDRLDAGFVWDGVHSTGIVDRESDAPVEDDGLPETIEQRTFPSMRRQAVLVQDVDDARGLPVIGPFRSSGLLPGSSVAVWLVTTPAFADGAMRCAESARRDGVEVFGK